MLTRFVFVLAAWLVAAPAMAQTTPADSALLVSTVWLAEHLRDPGLVLIHTSQGAPVRDVIAGARDLPHESLMRMAPGHDLATVSDLVTELERAGVSNASHVVIYGEPLSSGWLFFVLDYLGHDRKSMLDGGLEKWKAEGRPVSAVGAAPARGRFQPQIREQLRASAETVQNRATGTVALLDARSEREFAAGHIPDARLLTWQNVYADIKLQQFKSPAEIGALFAAAGASSGKTAITYCQIGLRASLLYFAARYAGLNASNYVGSWSDWLEKGLPREPSR